MVWSVGVGCALFGVCCVMIVARCLLFGECWLSLCPLFKNIKNMFRCLFRVVVVVAVVIVVVVGVVVVLVVACCCFVLVGC